MEPVPDDVLSRAVVVFVWGSPKHPWPARERQLVRQLFRDQAQALLLRIDDLLAELGKIRPDGDLAMYGFQIEQSLRLHHPELGDEACKALAGLFTYGWR